MKQTFSLALAVLTFAACGGDDATVDLDAAPGVDGEVADATPPDAVPPDAMTAPVTVRARTDVGPFAGALVVFFDAAGDEVASATTDAAGEASALVPPGGSVMAAVSAASRAGYLWVAPEPGDVLELFTGTVAVPTVSTTIVVPAVGGTTQYQVSSECGFGVDASSAVGMNYDQRPDCAIQDFRVARFTGAGQVGSFYVPDQPVAAGGTVDLSAGTYASVVSRTASVTAIPATASSFGMQSTLHHNGHAVGNTGSGAPTPSGGQASITFDVDAVPAASLLTVAAYFEASSSVYFYDLGDQSDASIDASFAPSNLASGTYVDATDVLSWSYAASGQAPDGVFAELHFGSPPSFASFGGDAIVWYVLAPPGGEVVMPAIPSTFTNLPVTLRSLTGVGLRSFRHTGGLAPIRMRAFGVQDVADLVTTPGTLALSIRGFGPA